jgi:hypothetical protein
VSLRAVAGISSAVANILAKCGIPFIIAPTGTMGNNGAITLGTALPTTYANAYIYLPANAIQAGSSVGWYFCQMSSATVGTVFNNTYTTGVPSIPASPTAFVSTGPGAYTGVTTAVSGPQISIPAGSLGILGELRTAALCGTINNANTKTLTLTVGGSTVKSLAITTSVSCEVLSTVYCRGSQSAQVSHASGQFGPGTAGGSPVYNSINFANAQTWILGGQLAVATDFLVLEAFAIEVMP